MKVVMVEMTVTHEKERQLLNQVESCVVDYINL